MNLKEAFHTQNLFTNLLSYAKDYLLEIDNVMTVKEKHFRSKAVEGQNDEVLDLTNLESKKFPADKVIDFILMLLDEREKLAQAISKAKLNMNFDLDAAVEVNKQRHSAVKAFDFIVTQKSSNVVQKNQGRGYVFNNEGNQIEYRYDIERIKTIDFDRNRLRRVIKALYDKADEISTSIDSALLNTKVDYEVPFNVYGYNDSIIEEYIESKNKKTAV